MTEPGANQQYDLWVDRCRQQLERGAAGNALASWMQSEGVSAEMAAAILQAARGGAGGARGQPAVEDSTPAAPPDSVSTGATSQGEVQPQVVADPAMPGDDNASAGEAATAASATPHAFVPDNASAVFAKAFAKPDSAPPDDTLPVPDGHSQPDAGSTFESAPPQDPPAIPPIPPASPDVLAAEAPASPASIPVAQPPPQAAAEQEHALDPPAPPVTRSNPFGTPRPPIVFAPAPAGTGEKPRNRDTLPEFPPQETPAAERIGENERQGVDVGNENDEANVRLDESPPPVSEPGAGAALAPEDGVSNGAAHESGAADREDSLPDGIDSHAVSPGPSARRGGGELTGDEPADTRADDQVAEEGPGQVEPSAGAPTAPRSPDGSSADDELPGMTAADSPHRFRDELGDSAPRTGMNIRHDQHPPPAETDGECDAEEWQRGPDPSAEPIDDTVAEPAGESNAGADADDQTVGPPPQPFEISSVGGPDGGGPGPVGTANGNDGETQDVVRDQCGPKSGAASRAFDQSTEGELARAIREAERDARRTPDSPPLPDPKTDEEFAAAAKQLGISFRDHPEADRPLAPHGQDDDMRRVARQLGISFRDDPADLAATEPDDSTAEVARQLGINFRDAYRAEEKPKSLLARYWPIVLVMVLAAIAMPIVAVVLMFATE